MKKFLLVIYILFSLTLLLYVALPNFEYPDPPPEFVQSIEPADTETALRRGYFTNLTRQEVLDWYKTKWDKHRIGIKLPTYLLNYPPEEAGSIIRDQTRSTFLQEVVHPFRETLFINGYEPAVDDDKNKININGVHYRQKIIVKYVPSNLLIRLLVTTLTLFCIPLLYFSYNPELTFWKKKFFNKT